MRLSTDDRAREVEVDVREFVSKASVRYARGVANDGLSPEADLQFIRDSQR